MREFDDFYDNDPRCPKCKGDPCDDCCRGCGAGPEEACDPDCGLIHCQHNVPQNTRCMECFPEELPVNIVTGDPE